MRSSALMPAFCDKMSVMTKKRADRPVNIFFRRESCVVVVLIFRKKPENKLVRDVFMSSKAFGLTCVGFFC